MSNDFKASKWKPMRKGSLLGFVTVETPSGLIFHEVSILASNGTYWASPPSKPMLDGSGSVMTDDTGKRRYSPVVSFASKAIRDRFSGAIIAAVRAAFPEELD